MKECNFNLKNKYKLTVGIFVGILGLILLGNFIATCGFEYDNKVSSTLYKGMDYEGIRLGTGGTILDGYIESSSYAFPIIFLVIISGGKGMQINRPKSGLGKHFNLRFIVLTVITLIYLYVGVSKSYDAIIADEGFGTAEVNVEFLIGKKALISIFVISLVINFTIYSLLIGYMEKFMINNKDFLKRRIGRQGLVAIFFGVIMGIVITVLKNGMGRPYGYDINFTGEGGSLEKIEKGFPNQGDHYVKHQDKFNGGFGGPSGDKLEAGPKDYLDQPGGKPARGGFAINRKHGEALYPPQTAFPSGHTQQTMLIGLAITVFFYNIKETKKTNIVKYLLTALAFIYLLDVMSALIVSTSHGLSDVAFSYVGGVIVYIIGYYSINGIFNSLNKRFKVNNY